MQVSNEPAPPATRRGSQPVRQRPPLRKPELESSPVIWTPEKSWPNSSAADTRPGRAAWGPGGRVWRRSMRARTIWCRQTAQLLAVVLMP